MKKAIYIIIAALVVAGIAFLVAAPAKVSKLDSFATCIKASGATFYGAFWCPHCQAEKARFGSASHLLPYVECSQPDGQTQTQVCINKKITSYPTWEFPVNVPATATTTATTSILRITGEQELIDLARQTGCVLPSNTTTIATTTSSGASTLPK